MSRTDALAEAFDKSEETAEQTELEGMPEVEETEAPEIEPEAEAEPVAEEAPKTEDPEIVAGETEELEIEAEDKPAAKAPQSWTPAMREEFVNLSPELQEFINNRENEVSKGLVTSTQARKFQEEFNSVVQPFEPLIAAEGGTPMQAVQTLLGTAATLQTGSPQAKAMRIAELINHYGVDVAQLDSILSGQGVQDPQTMQMNQMLQQHLAPVQQFMAQQQQNQFAQQQQMQVDAATEFDSFMSSNEFAEDVRQEMAVLIENNMADTYDEAYKKAIGMRPDIGAIIQARKDAENAKQTQREVQRKSAASVSIPAGGGVVATPESPTTRAGQIAAAMDR